MTAKSMDVFALRDAVVDEYRAFATSFTTIHAADIREQVEAIYAEGRFWPDPLLQINPRFEAAKSIADWVGPAPAPTDAGDLPGEGAAARAAPALATGTGSGKSLCFFIP